MKKKSPEICKICKEPIPINQRSTKREMCKLCFRDRDRKKAKESYLKRTVPLRKKRIKSIILPIKREYYRQIRDGLKPIEYREDKPYWRTRLTNSDGTFKKFEDGVFFRNGYNLKSPLMYTEHIRSKEMVCPLKGYHLYGKIVIGIMIKNPKEIIPLKEKRRWEIPSDELEGKDADEKANIPEEQAIA